MSIQESILRYTIDSSGAKRGADQFKQATDASKVSAKEASVALSDYEKSIKNAGTAAAFSAASHETSMKKMRESLAQVTAQQKAHNDVTQLSKYQLMNLSYQIQDVASQLSTSTPIWRIFIQQGGQIAGVFGGFGELLKRLITPTALLTTGVGAATLGLVAMMAATESLNRTLTGIQNSFAVTGRATEFTRTQIKLLIDQVTLYEGQTRESAIATVQAFANARNLGGKYLVELTKITADFAAATGKDVPAAAQALASGLRDPLTFVQQMSEQFGNLTLSQYSQIEAAQKSGQSNKALSLTIEYLRNTLKDANQNGVTPFEHATRDLRKAWSELTHSLTDTQWVQNALKGFAMWTQAIADFLKKDTPKEALNKKLDDLLKERADIQNDQSYAIQTPDSVAANRRALARIAQEITELQKQRKALVDLQGGNLTVGNSPKGIASNDNDVGLFNPEKAKQLIDQFGGVQTKRAELQQQISQLGEYAKQDAGNFNLYAKAISNAQAQLGALKELTDIALEQFKNEAEVLKLPINQREAYRAKIEAVTAAKNAGLTPDKAMILGYIAEQKALLELNDAYQQQLININEQTKQTEELTAARQKGARALVEQQAANEAHNAFLKNAAVNENELKAAIINRQAAQQLDALSAQISDQQDAVDLAKAQLYLVGQSSDERARSLELEQKRIQLDRQFSLPGMEKEKALLLQMTAQQIDLNAEASKMNAIYDEARGSLDDTFTQVLSGGITKFSDFANSISNIFKTLAAKIAQQLIFQPIINSIGGELGLGGFSSAGGSITSQGSALGGSSFGGIKDLFSSLSDKIGSIGDFFGFGSGSVTAAGEIAPLSLGGIDGIAGVGTNISSSVASAGSIFSGLGSILGGAGAGMGIGGLVGGLTGGNSMGSSIGGAIGGIAGSFIPIPVVGPLLGGALGGLLGGLFGAKKSVGPNANTNLNIRNGRFFVGETGADNGGDAAGTAQLAKNAVDSLNTLIDNYGIAAYDPYNGGLSKTGTPHAIGFEVYTGNINKGKPQTPDEVLRFALAHGLIKSTAGGQLAGDFKTNVLYGTGGKDDPYQRVINNTKATTIADFAKDLDIAKLIVDSKKASTALDSVQQSFKDLSDQADDYVERAKKLGFTTGEVLKAFATNFDLSITDQINKIEDPFKFAMDQLIKDQDARLEYAKKIGADITNVQKLNLLEQKNLIEQFGNDTADALKKAGDDLKKYLDGQLLGSNSNLTPAQQLQEAQKQFQSQLETARGAGANADIGALTSSANNVLELGKNVLGGATQDYAFLQDSTRALLQQLGKQLGLPGFAVGGEFQVNGIGGTDSQVVAFKATPGETVKVTPSNKQDDGRNLQLLVSELQKSIAPLAKELKQVNKNLSTNRNIDMVVRK